MKKGNAVTDNPGSNEITPQDILREVYGELSHFVLLKKPIEVENGNPFDALRKYFDAEFGSDTNKKELPF